MLQFWLQLHTNVLIINRDLVWQSSDTLTHVRSSDSAATSSFLFLDFSWVGQPDTHDSF